jgi:hypothetical protein
MRCGEPTSDAELKMDWTEPPTDLDAMGFCSGCLVFGDDQIAARTDFWEMLTSICCGEVARLRFCGDGEGGSDEVECDVSDSPMPRNIG